MIQVYAARTWGWKGALAVHSWVAFKPEGAAGYDRYEVVGWGVGQRCPHRAAQPAAAGRALGRQRPDCSWPICAGPRPRR